MDSTTYDIDQFPAFMDEACDKVSQTLTSNEHPACKNSCQIIFTCLLRKQCSGPYIHCYFLLPPVKYASFFFFLQESMHLIFVNLIISLNPWISKGK